MLLLYCCSLPSKATINTYFNLEDISHFSGASLPPNNCSQCSALTGQGGQAGKETALGELPIEKKLNLWRLAVYKVQEMIVAFVGVATWFRNGTATNPRPLRPSARRHQCGGRQMAFIDG